MTRPAVDWDDDYSAPRRRLLPGKGALRRTGWGLGVLVVAGLLYYAVGGFLMSVVDDDPDFRAPETPPAASRSVATAAALIAPGVNQHFRSEQRRVGKEWVRRC